MIRWLNKLYDLLHGHNIAYRIIKKYKGYKIVSIYSGVGDRVFALAYLKSYLSKNNISKYKIVSATPENAVYRYFGFDKDILIISSGLIRRSSEYISLIFNCPALTNHNLWINIISAFNFSERVSHE